MMSMMNTADFQTQLTSIMEIMARTAFAEISKLFEENSLLLRLQIARFTEENESLKKKCHFLESELKSVLKTAGKTNGTEAPFGHPGHTDAGHRPTIDNVFGKEWCMNLWRHEKSNVGEQEDGTQLDSIDITEEAFVLSLEPCGTLFSWMAFYDSQGIEDPINLLDEEPDVIMIKEETLKNDSCSVNNKLENDKSSSLTGSAMTSDERCVNQSSEDYITYTVPSDDQIQANIQQPQPEDQTLDGTISTQGDSTTGSDLNFFQMTVAQEKKYKCVFCVRTFEYLSHMQRHMRRHSGEKPFVCTVCGRRFAQKTYLTTHERTHSGERPYSCMECGKSFSQKCSLNVHLRSHTGEKPYSCSECGKSYAYKIALKTHRC